MTFLQRDPIASMPRLRHVVNTLSRGFGRRRPHPADPDSRRNVFNAMCGLCDWQREGSTSQGANDMAMKHGWETHGTQDVGFVRVEMR
jgi:hypothetical protein